MKSIRDDTFVLGHPGWRFAYQMVLVPEGGGLVDEKAYRFDRGGQDSHEPGPISTYKFANHASEGPFHQSNSNTRKRQRVTKLTDPLTSDSRRQFVGVSVSRIRTYRYS